MAVRDVVLGALTMGEAAVRGAKQTARLFQATTAELRSDEALRIVGELAWEGDEARACILLDDPEPDVAHRLFGRLRDELWQTGIVWVVAADERRRAQFVTPPADAFFERLVAIAPLTDEQQRELVRRRLQPGDDRALLDVRAANGSPRALLAALRDAASADDAQVALRHRAERELDAAKIGRLESMMLAEIENGALASASDPEWLSSFGVSRQRAQQVLSRLEGSGLVRADVLPGANGRPRKVFSRLDGVA